MKPSLDHPSGWALRMTGAVLTAGAFALFIRLAALEHGHALHEPAIAYLLALIGFACASAGTALLVNGSALFDRIAVSDRWMPGRHHQD